MNSVAAEKPWCLKHVKFDVLVIFMRNCEMRDEINDEMTHLSNKGSSNPTSIKSST